MHVYLVAWHGDISVLAARLNLEESDLSSALRRISTTPKKADPDRRWVSLPINNLTPVFSALRRKLAAPENVPE